VHHQPGEIHATTDRCIIARPKHIVYLRSFYYNHEYDSGFRHVTFDPRKIGIKPEELYTAYSDVEFESQEEDKESSQG